MDYRVILYHKQATSARTRFMKFSYDSVFAFSPVPELAQLCDQKYSNMVIHPAAIMKEVEEKIGFPDASLKVESEYQHTIDVPGKGIQVLLAEITTTDPPFDTAENNNASFIDLTQARGLPQVELELLRSAYELILGG